MSEHWIDRAWRDVLKGDMDDAISFFMPSLAAERDYSQVPEAADPVHPAIGGKSDKDSTISDVCFNVALKNGSFSRIPVLASKRMLDAGGSPSKRGEYSLELLELIKARGLENEKALRFRKFTRRILQLNKDDIDPKVREVWKVQFKTQEEVRKELYIRWTEEEKAFEIARSMRADGLSPDVIRKYTGLDREDILELGSSTGI